MNPDSHDLIQRHMAGLLTEDEAAVLQTRLKADTNLRRLYLHYMNLDVALEAQAGSRDRVIDLLRTAPPTENKPAGRWLSWRPLTAAAAGIVLTVSAWWWQGSQRVLATVVNDAGVEELSNGAKLRGETHSLKGGSVELVSARGARIVIEAPAEFRFETDQRLHVMRGRLSAEVPPAAKGFTVVTPSGDAVDLGTRFGVDVPASGAAEVHVFEGEVIAKASGNATRQSLRGGDAVAMDGGASTSRDLRSSAFIQPDEMHGLSAGLAAGQRARSEAAMVGIRSDPTLIALLDFESAEAQPGVFRTVQGRWPGSRAPEFVNVGDHLKLDVGGEREWPQITLAAWVRLDQLGAPYQSLLHTDGWTQERPGQLHWMVTRHTTMRLALRGNTLAPGSEEQEMFPDSKTSVLPEQGRWMHLATVYDAEAKMVRFYLNGRFDKETRQSIAHPAKLGPGQIGNWDRQDRKLSGRVDELILLGRAMSDAEITELFEAGNPYH